MTVGHLPVRSSFKPGGEMTGQPSIHGTKDGMRLHDEAWGTVSCLESPLSSRPSAVQGWLRLKGRPGVDAGTAGHEHTTVLYRACFLFLPFARGS